MVRRQYTSLPSSLEEAPRLIYVSQDRYSGDWNSSLHTHGCAELFFITDGHGRFRTQYEEFPVAIHDLVVVNANVLHTELSQMDSPLEYIVLGVEGLEAVSAADGCTMLHLHSGWRELLNCLDLMLKEAREGRPGWEELCGHLLGVVTETGTTWSTVRTILDSDTSIGALVFRTGGSAMAQGDFALMSQGRLQLNYLGAEPDVVAGDLIVTSGLGGYYPSQLVIGCVEEGRTSENGLAQYAVLRPEAELVGLTQVFIVTSFDIVD